LASMIPVQYLTENIAHGSLRSSPGMRCCRSWCELIWMLNLRELLLQYL
jgi:hypothetical protein